MGDESKPKMVLVHGYGGSGALLYRIFKHLITEFHIFAIDLIGMGSSSRPPFDCENNEQADFYMLDYMEKWRVAMNNLTDFVLVGHSYGGYITGNYAAKYPQHIQKLILLSPLGCKVPPPGWTFEGMRFAGGRGPPSWAISISKYLWGKITPFSIARKLSECRVKKLIAGYVIKHQPGKSPAENSAMENYLY